MTRTSKNTAEVETFDNMEEPPLCHTATPPTEFITLVDFNERLLLSGDYADARIICTWHEEDSDGCWTPHTQEWVVHKAIICPKSKSLTTMMTNGIGKFDDIFDGPEVLHATIHFMYTMQYDARAPTTEKLLRLHIGVTLFAYELEMDRSLGLHSAAKEGFKIMADWCWRTPDFANVAELLFLNVDEHVGSEDPHLKDFRQVVASAIVTHFSEIFSPRGRREYTGIRNLLTKSAKLSTRICEQIAIKL